MSAARRDEPEQEISIRQRGNELYHGDDPSASPTRPFAEYLRETPSAPLPSWVKAVLWALALVVALLFAAALWRSIQRASARPSKTPRPSASSTANARLDSIVATSPRSNSLLCLPPSPNQESQRS